MEDTDGADDISANTSMAWPDLGCLDIEVPRHLATRPHPGRASSSWQRSWNTAMGSTHKVIVAVSACVICFAVGVSVGFSEAGGDLRAEFFGHDRAACPRPGDILTDEVLTEGCVNSRSGSVEFLPTWTCTDGRTLLSDDRMFGFSGERIKASDDTSADPAYAKAYRECVPQ